MMQRIHLISFVFSVCGLLVAWGTRAASEDLPLLSDRGVVVTASEYSQAWLALPAAERDRLLTAGNSRELLAALLRRKLMAAEAVRLGLDQVPETRAKLDQARVRILGGALRERVEAQIPLPDFTALAREHYASRQSELITQGEYQVAHLLLRVACEAEREAKLAQIKDLKLQLDAGGDFAALARAHSEDTSAKAGGKIGDWVKTQDLDPDFAQALAQLPDGGVSEPVKTRFGYHLIQRQAYRPPGVRPFDEVREQLEKEIRASYLRHQLAEAQSAFDPSADAQVDQAALEALLTELAATPAQSAGP